MLPICWLWSLYTPEPTSLLARLPLVSLTVATTKFGRVLAAGVAGAPVVAGGVAGVPGVAVVEEFFCAKTGPASRPAPSSAAMARQRMAFRSNCFAASPARQRDGFRRHVARAMLSAMSQRRRTPPRPAPTAEDLRAAALPNLARYAATEAGLQRVLLRRIA